MYILHHRRKPSHTVTAVLVLAVIVGAAALFAKSYLSDDTTIGPTPAAVVSTVKDNKTAVKHITDPLFKFDLPDDWEPVQLADQPTGSRSWHNTKLNKGVRIITLFMDSVPANYAINRAVAIQPETNRMTVSGDVSDNCINFTGSDKTAQASATGKAPAKWQGVDFICDTGNYVRNVVGTGSAGSINATKLVGSTAGAHSVFFTYTDNSSSPNFSIFTDMLQTFELK